jgi:hypothetical protein
MLSAFVQCANGQGLEQLRSGESNRGIVVEELVKGSEGERAGLERGDILLHWLREDTTADIESPFDLASLETEQAPRGSVTIWGVRGNEKRAWILGPDSWGILARPDFPEPFLNLYVHCEDLVTAGKVSDTTECWRTTSGEAFNSVSVLTQVWLFVHTSQMFAGAKQWQQVDRFYREAIQNASGLSPAVRIVVFRSLAKALQTRSEWDNAASYYQQAVEADSHETRRLHPNAWERRSRRPLLGRSHRDARAREPVHLSMAALPDAGSDRTDPPVR